MDQNLGQRLSETCVIELSRYIYQSLSLYLLLSLSMHLMKLEVFEADWSASQACH